MGTPNITKTLIYFFFVTLFAQLNASELIEVNRVVAQVNDEVVTWGEIEMAMEKLNFPESERLKRAEAEINKVKKTILYSEKYEITEQDIDTDLGNVKAEALGMKVAKEEKEQLRDEKYDWKREKKLVDNKIADDK